MKFVVVEGRVPRGLPRWCAFCCEPIEHGYTRDLSTWVVYCGPGCAERHMVQSRLSMPKVSRQVA